MSSSKIFLFWNLLNNFSRVTQEDCPFSPSRLRDGIEVYPLAKDVIIDKARGAKLIGEVAFLRLRKVVSELERFVDHHSYILQWEDIKYNSHEEGIYSLP